MLSSKTPRAFCCQGRCQNNRRFPCTSTPALTACLHGEFLNVVRHQVIIPFPRCCSNRTLWHHTGERTSRSSAAPARRWPEGTRCWSKPGPTWVWSGSASRWKERWAMETHYRVRKLGSSDNAVLKDWKMQGGTDSVKGLRQWFPAGVPFTVPRGAAS